MGKLGRAWVLSGVGAWHVAWVHGGGDVVMLYCEAHFTTHILHYSIAPHKVILIVK